MFFISAYSSPHIQRLRMFFVAVALAQLSTLQASLKMSVTPRILLQSAIHSTGQHSLQKKGGDKISCSEPTFKRNIFQHCFHVLLEKRCSRKRDFGTRVSDCGRSRAAIRKGQKSCTEESDGNAAP